MNANDEKGGDGVASRRLVIACLLGLGATALGQTPPPKESRKKRLLAIGATQGFQHDSISYALGKFWSWGIETGLWETYIRTDTQLITKKKLGGNAKNLDFFDAVYFYTTGELSMDDEQKEALLSFVRDDGKGFIGGHSAGDTFYKWPEYGDLVGGYFDGHPWHQLVRVNVEDREFPATRHLPPSFEITDEIYQFRDFSREKVRVLASLDTSSVDMTKPSVKRMDKDFALIWARRYGKGRVLVDALGHENQVYDRPDMKQVFVEGLKWAMELTDGDATPRPKLTR
jgi:uncharacterized protein